MLGTALSLLKPGERCELIMTDGDRRQGLWNPNLPGFELCDGHTEGIAFLCDVDEWWPVKSKH
jgi:hypothetical protein